ncbi:hypothetical protein B5E65_03580 [Gemmiger sp. An120]|uniref:BlaI/MecI/CopY family transcriptional regulator n=1 Tax=Gemmiger sp. An120 TaxID=1965549 RepID=UPI000B3A6364|nr:BlaI/MecI/CopY family transcriptional regulator [Gemmiger sp. An120]OUQ43448.1 hypothetical protein B5E65_03580 [Gemmiger sp. An120]HIX33078.1 BlaI/MecI/CopY family transcriptional regulator [Candidatus Gemmiger avium]
MEPIKLFDAELTVMQYLWENGRVMATRIAEDLMAQYGWKKSTTYIVLKRLEGKGAIRRQNPKYWVEPLVSRSQVQHSETSSLLDKMFGGSFTSLFANFLSSEQVSAGTLEELQALLDEKKKEQ